MPELMEVPPEQLDFDANLFQCAFWARFKAAREHSAQTFHLHHRGTRVPLVVVQRPVTADATIGYAPHGPEVELPHEAQGPFLEGVSEALRRRVPSSCRLLRWDLPWTDPYTASGEWSAPPEPRVREMRMNFGCRRWALRKARTDLQPPDTCLFDLGPEPASLLRAMHRKHRYCVRAALRRGVTVKVGGEADLFHWHRLYLETAGRAGIAAESLDYFRELFARFVASEG